MAKKIPPPESTIKWSALLKAIKEESCVLCLGPEIFVNEKGESLDVQFLKFLKKEAELDKDVIIYPDGLFHFKQKNKRSHIIVDMERFYSQAFPEATNIIEKLVEIPFHLVIILTPDHLFANVAASINKPFTRDFYFKDNPPRKRFKPTKENPMAYHLLGSIGAQADESLILTNDDIYAYLKSIFEEKSMSDELRTVIRSTDHFICLGLPLEKWYMRLMLRVLNLHVNDESTKYVNKPSAKGFEPVVFQDQFNFTFISDNIESFSSSLLSKCKEDNLIRKDKQPMIIRDSLAQHLQNLIGEGDMDEAFALLETTLKEKEKWDKCGDEFTNYKGQYKVLKRQYHHQVITEQEFIIGLNKIRVAVLEFISDELTT